MRRNEGYVPCPAVAPWVLLLLVGLALPAQAQFSPGFGMPQPPQSSLTPEPPPTPGQDLAGMRPGVDTSAFVTRVPNGTLEGAKHFLGLAAVQVQLLLQYSPQHAPEATVPAGLNVVSSAAFTKTARGGTRNIQLLAVSREGGFDLFVLGEEVQGDDRHPNPDLTTLLNEIRSLEDTERLRGRGALESQIYQLSYVQADRALAGLKALGYSTIEYQANDGEDTYTHVYKPIENGEKGRLPVVVRLIDSSKTSLMDSPPLPSNKPGGFGMAAQPAFGGGASFGGGSTVAGSAVPDIGGTYLHQVTAAEPQQRLLIVYDRTDPNSLARLLNILHDKLDTPARQVLIEAQVVEINTDKLKQLGVTFSTSDGKLGVGIQPDAAGNDSALSLNLNTAVRQLTRQYTLQLQALVQSGDANVLSSPSVLVLDGRQARIQIGKQVPVVKSTTTVAGTTSSVDYFPVGIVLNLRPRTSEDGQHVSMQVETIVSDINGTSNGQATNVVVAPVIDNRQVQTFVRVADNTPFIIGGLVSTTQQLQKSGVPVLSEIPFIGALFGTTSYQDVKKEVIVVITPHVVPREESTFSYVIPKDSSTFSSFGDQLFRNAYRVQTNDIFDLKFISNSEVARNLRQSVRSAVDRTPSLGSREPFASILKGNIPGEDILVRRMIWEIIQRSHYGDHIDTDRIIYFKDGLDLNNAVAYKPERLNGNLTTMSGGANTLTLTFDAQTGMTAQHPFRQSRALELHDTLRPDQWYEKLQSCYTFKPDSSAGSWCIPVADYSIGTFNVVDALRSALVMKRILSLNDSMPLTIQDFKAGRQLIFPSENELTQGFWVVDQDVARYFDEAILYYPAFERAFLQQSNQIQEGLGQAMQ